MKTFINFLLISSFLLIQSSFLYSQNQTDVTKIVPGKKYKIVLFDDSEIIGKVIASDSLNISIETDAKVMIIVPKSNILYYSSSITPNKYNYTLSLLGGISVFSGDNYYSYNGSTKTSAGPNFNLSGIYYISDSKAVKIDAGFTYLKPKYDNTYYADPMYPSSYSYDGGDVTMFSLKGNILVGRFVPDERIIMYASLGFGIHYTKTKEMTTTHFERNYPDTTLRSYTYSYPSHSEVNALISIGASLGYRLSKRFGVQAEIEYNLVTGSNNFIIFGGNNYFPIRAGIFYIFQ
jgi:hypothetical protein